jgi:hydroxymethylpyrimidine/phosphomethylpyrimidine kinase
MNSSTLPVILCFSGADPTGGAGIQADIEAIASNGGHCAPVVTAVTVQDTSNVFEFAPIPEDLVISQARAVLEDMPVRAIKIGMIGTADNAQAIHSILRDYPELPVVYDPVFSSETDGLLSQPDLIPAVRSLILPLTRVLTPNIHEVYKLSPGADTPAAAALGLLETECDYILVTGTHGKTSNVVHALYADHRELKTYHYDRLPGKYHGCGCTLAASIAALLAQEMNTVNAIHQALDYTYKTLLNARQLGMGQQHPNRLFWKE